jgi:hypothetical protein
MKKGEDVTWKFGAGTAEGKVQSHSEKSVTKTIKGKKITRNGTPANPAVTVKQENGATALKLESELKKAK